MNSKVVGRNPDISVPEILIENNLNIQINK